MPIMPYIHVRSVRCSFYWSSRSFLGETSQIMFETLRSAGLRQICW